MADLEKQDRMVAVDKAEEEEKERFLEGMPVLDFDMLCSTVALQTQGKWSKLEHVEGGDVVGGEGGDFGGVLRMWEGELLDCFDDRRIALESAWSVLSLLQIFYIYFSIGCFWVCGKCLPEEMFFSGK